MPNPLRYCNKCKENSVRVKIYKREDGYLTRVLYCINKGCGYKQRLPFPEECKNAYYSK